MERLYKGSELDAQNELLRRQIEVIDLRRLEREVEEGKRRRVRGIVVWGLFLAWVVGAFALGAHYGGR